MNWLKEYHRETKNREKIKKQKIEKSILDELKSRHFFEKKQEIEVLKKRLEILEKEIECYR